jgi:hypothetical protein
MNLLLEIALTLAYTGLFLLVIRRWAFFRIGSIPAIWIQGVFLAKVLSGFVLSMVYTHYYTDRATADIWKYFDDGLVMFSALREQPLDYFRMLFGMMNDSPHFDRYYSEMGHWYRPTAVRYRTTRTPSSASTRPCGSSHSAFTKSIVCGPTFLDWSGLQGFSRS